METALPDRLDAPEDPNVVTTLPEGIERQRPERIRRKRHSWLGRVRIARRVRGAAAGEYEEAFARFREGVAGELPKPGTGVILAACNEYYYWHFARTLVASMDRTGGRQAVHLHLCEPRPAVLTNIGQIAARLTNTALTWTVDDCLLATGLRHRTVYYAASRFLLAPLILERTRAPLLAIDVDGIAVRPVWQAYAQTGAGADIVVVERPEEAKPTMKVLASAFGFNATPAGQRFAGTLARALAAILAIRPGYHIDQIAIHFLLERLRREGKLHVAAMPKAFWDHDFGADSVIWTAKGWSRKESSGFQDARREVERFFAGLPAKGGDAT